MPPNAPPLTCQRKENQMHDPVEIRCRIERLMARLSRRDDYGELLANGHVVRQVEDAAAWRAAIRAQARADRIACGPEMAVVVCSRC